MSVAHYLAGTFLYLTFYFFYISNDDGIGGCSPIGNLRFYGAYTPLNCVVARLLRAEIKTYTIAVGGSGVNGVLALHENKLILCRAFHSVPEEIDDIAILLSAQVLRCVVNRRAVLTILSRNFEVGLHISEVFVPPDKGIALMFGCSRSGGIAALLYLLGLQYCGAVVVVEGDGEVGLLLGSIVADCRNRCWVCGK